MLSALSRLVVLGSRLTAQLPVAAFRTVKSRLGFRAFGAFRAPAGHRMRPLWGGFATPALQAAAPVHVRSLASSSLLEKLQEPYFSMVAVLIVDLAINWLGWAVAAAFQTEKFYDLLGSTSFITCAALSLGLAKDVTSRKVLVSCFVFVWALRLGSFLFYRVLKTGHDSRFTEMKKQPGVFFVAWTAQAVWVYVSLLPVLVLHPLKFNPAFGQWSDVLGTVVFAAGLLCEAIADWQKLTFKLNPDNKGKFIDTGLWKYARYPNYFGEIMIWTGIWLTCIASFRGAQYATIVSPVWVTFQLLVISGVRLQEDQAKKRWADNQAYQEYRARTNLLVPLPNIFKAKQ